MSLRIRIFLLFCLVLAIGIAGLTAWTQGGLRPRYLEAQEDPLVEFAQVMAAFVSAHGVRRIGEQWQPDPDFLAQAMPSALQAKLDAQIYAELKQSIDLRVYVTDAQGIVLYDSDNGRDVGEDYSAWRDVYRTLRGEYGARGTSGDPIFPQGSTMFVAAPIRHSGDVIGVLTIGKPTRMAERFLDDARRELVVGGAIAMVIAMLGAALVYLWLSRPLQQLQRFVEDVQAGKRVAAPEVGNNEVGQVVRSVDAMRKALDGKAYVEDYVQSLTHELKSPTSAIRGAAELLTEDMSASDRDRFVGNIHTQSQRLQDILERMLHLAAIEARPGLESSKEVQLAALVREDLETVHPMAEAGGVRIVADLADDAVVMGDRFLLSQAVTNLLSNAVGFAREQVDIVLEVSPAGTITLRCTDDGPGIPDYAQERIFERFYSLERPDGGSGSGLGLAFVQEVAHLHGGTVSVRNRDANAGCCAELVLPARTG